MFQKVIDDNRKYISKKARYLSNEKDQLCSDIDHYLLAQRNAKMQRKAQRNAKYIEVLAGIYYETIVNVLPVGCLEKNLIADDRFFLTCNSMSMQK